jgi:two-component system, chemotaxis family, protein-glutamate methylesterase/glutaminase
METLSRKLAAPRLIGIVSATGGITAVPESLGGLPPEFPVPIFIIPSIHSYYLSGLAARLDLKCRLQVIVAEDGQIPEPGTVYVASGTSCLLTVQQGLLRLERGESVYEREPKNALFRSMAREVGSGALAVILTGMGADGAQGMKEVRDAGGYTIVQDRATSLVYGTAKFADGLNAVCESLPIQEIAPRLVALVGRA